MKTIYYATLCSEEIQHQQKKIKIVENIEYKNIQCKVISKFKQVPVFKVSFF